MRLLYSTAVTLALALSVERSLWAIAAASPPILDASISVALEDGVDGVELLSVRARAVSLQALLAEMSRLVGFEITGMFSTERMISIEFKRFDIDRALRRLLSGENFIFIYNQPEEGSSPKLSRVVVVGSGTPPPAVPPTAHAAWLSDGASAVSGSRQPTQMDWKLRKPSIQAPPWNSSYS